MAITSSSLHLAPPHPFLSSIPRRPLLPSHLFSTLPPLPFPSSALSPLAPSLSHSSIYKLPSSPILHSKGLYTSLITGFNLGPKKKLGDAPFAARCMSGSSEVQLEELVKSKNSQNPVVVYSKTWCPYCSSVKDLFNKLGVQPLVVELDELVEESDLQTALQRLTGQSSVPNVFIGGKHIGGCDDTVALHNRGKLIPLLKAAGAKF